MNLTGTIPSTLGSLTSLTWLGLIINDLSGPHFRHIARVVNGPDGLGFEPQCTDPGTFLPTWDSLTLPAEHQAKLSMSGPGAIPSALQTLTAQTEFWFHADELMGTILSYFSSSLTWLATLLFQQSDHRVRPVLQSTLDKNNERGVPSHLSATATKWRALVASIVVLPVVGMEDKRFHWSGRLVVMH